MPNTMSLPPDKPNNYGLRPTAGIEITWVSSAQRLDISGFYDGFVHIQGASMSLKEFFTTLGITQKDCTKAFKEDGNGR